MTTDTLYEEDFMLWTERQAEELRRLAREGSNLPLDWDNLAEEVESLGRSERHQVRSLVHQIVTHLVKLAYSPAKNAKIHWESEIGYFRRQLEGTLKDSPSLRRHLPEIVADETPGAIQSAARSLWSFGEVEEAARVEGLSLSIAPEQVLQEGWFLPGTDLRDVFADKDRS